MYKSQTHVSYHLPRFIGFTRQTILLVSRHMSAQFRWQVGRATQAICFDCCCVSSIPPSLSTYAVYLTLDNYCVAETCGQKENVCNWNNQLEFGRLVGCGGTGWRYCWWWRKFCCSCCWSLELGRFIAAWKGVRRHTNISASMIMTNAAANNVFTCAESHRDDGWACEKRGS